MKKISNPCDSLRAGQLNRMVAKIKDNKPGQCDLEERVEAILDRKRRATIVVHLGTLDLINDLWKEVRRLRAEQSGEGD